MKPWLLQGCSVQLFKNMEKMLNSMENLVKNVDSRDSTRSQQY